MRGLSDANTAADTGSEPNNVTYAITVPNWLANSLADAQRYARTIALSIAFPKPK